MIFLNAPCSREITLIVTSIEIKGVKNYEVTCLQDLYDFRDINKLENKRFWEELKTTVYEYFSNLGRKINLVIVPIDSGREDIILA